MSYLGFIFLYTPVWFWEVFPYDIMDTILDNVVSLSWGQLIVGILGSGGIAAIIKLYLDSRERQRERQANANKEPSEAILEMFRTHFAETMKKLETVKYTETVLQSSLFEERIELNKTKLELSRAKEAANTYQVTLLPILLKLDRLLENMDTVKRSVSEVANVSKPYDEVAPNILKLIDQSEDILNEILTIARHYILPAKGDDESRPNGKNTSSNTD